MSDDRAGEERLARAVIAQALTDAGIHADGRERISVARPVQDAARSFLTAHAGSWKAARCYWADLADLDPEKLRTRTMELLGIEPPLVKEPQKPTSNEPLRLFYPVPKPEKPVRAPKVQAPPKNPSKRRQVLDMLMRPEGVSVEEVVQRFGWKKATAHSCIRFDVRNYGVEGLRCRDGRYRAFKRADDGRLIADAA